MTEHVLDVNRLVSARLELKLSQRQVADQLGVTANTISRLESGRSHEVLELGMLARLAAVLGVSARDLFPPPVAAGSGSDDEPPWGDDVQRVEAALLDAELLRSSELAIAMGWSLARTRQALAALGQRLASRGAILIRVDGRYRIRSRTGLLSDAERQRLARTRHSRYGLNTLEAGYLYQALAGPIDRGWDAKGAQAKERYGMGSLLKAGLVEHTGAHIHLTEDAAFSLMASAVRPVPLGTRRPAHRPPGNSTT